MDNDIYYIDQQLKEYKAAITQAYVQFRLDDESRIAAAHALINATVNEYRLTTDNNKREKLRLEIYGMLSMAAACHLISIDEIKERKTQAGIDRVEIPFKMVF